MPLSVTDLLAEKIEKCNRAIADYKREIEEIHPQVYTSTTTTTTTTTITTTTTLNTSTNGLKKLLFSQNLLWSGATAEEMTEAENMKLNYIRLETNQLKNLFIRKQQKDQPDRDAYHQMVAEHEKEEEKARVADKLKQKEEEKAKEVVEFSVTKSLVKRLKSSTTLEDKIDNLVLVISNLTSK